MNFDDAITRHAEWRIKLRSAMHMKQKLDVFVISKENNCELGKWLHGEGRRDASALPSYKACLDLHKAFHEEAGKIAVLINAGNYAEAEKLLAPGSAYSQVSTNIGGILIKLKYEHAKAA